MPASCLDNGKETLNFHSPVWDHYENLREFPVPVGVKRTNWWVLESGAYKLPLGVELNPAWVTNDVPTMAVCLHRDGLFYIHGASYHSPPNYGRLSGPYANLIVALVALRMTDAAGSPVDIVDYFDPLHGVPDETD